MQYCCSDEFTKVNGIIQIKTSKVARGFVPSVCNFPSVTRVSCDVYAVNGAGKSPTTTSYAYTEAKGWLSLHFTFIIYSYKQIFFLFCVSILPNL